MGLATLTHGGNTYQFRTNPNSITWTFNLVKYVDETYGGRVVQLLAVNIDSLTVTAHAGRGGWDHLYQTVLFFRDMLVNQRDSGDPGVFEYVNRGWKFSVYALGIPLNDKVTEVAREFTMTFKVQEDVSGIASAQTLDAELFKLKEGIGYEHNAYNWVSPTQADNQNPTPKDQSAPPGTATNPSPIPGVPGTPRGTSTPNSPIPGGLVP